MLTDGVDFGGVIPPDIAKEMAKLYKIKVYTIGVGSENTVEEVVNGVTEKNKLEYNEGLLKELADFTGGQYFHASDKTALKKIYEGINLMEKSRVEVVSYNKFTDNYRGILIAGLLILVIELVVRYAILRKFP
jgi:Ca-activated chloride channel family protein